MPGAPGAPPFPRSVRGGWDFHENVGLEIFPNLSGCSLNTNPTLPEQGSASLWQGGILSVAPFATLGWGFLFANFAPFAVKVLRLPPLLVPSPKTQTSTPAVQSADPAPWLPVRSSTR